MNMYDLIMKKKKGLSLTNEEIRYMIEGYTKEIIPDYQMSAMMMAICFQGMTPEETKNLTLAMAESGDILDLSAIKGIKVDKHSTGGVGDKTSLVLGPMVASLGVSVAKMSGRGLGHTGGTIDKLESFTGFSTSLSKDTFVKNVNEIGIAIAGQTADLAPADKKLYALRDVTGTVDQRSLIASSIMSKKLASGADAIVLDVKTGDGAFMKTLDDSTKLAEAMVSIGKLAGKEVVAVISDMEQPLGCAVGNSLEVQEAIDVLKCQGPEDITELSIELAGIMVYLSGVSGTAGLDRDEGIAVGKKAALEALHSGKALEKFRDFVQGQGGDPAITDDYGLMPQAALTTDVIAAQDGYVTALDAMKIGIASQHTGAGRQRKEDDIDLSAGIMLRKKRGDEVNRGDVLCTLYGNSEEKIEAAAEEAVQAFVIDSRKPEKAELIKKIIG